MKVFWIVVGAFVLLMAFIVTRPEFKQSFGKDFDASFKEAIEQKLAESCLTGFPGPDNIEFCACVAHKATTEMSKKQLMDQAYASKYIQSTVVPACRARANNKEKV